MYTKGVFMSAWPLLGAAIVACTLFAGAAFADPPAAPAADIRAAKVSLAGLDLSTPEGAHAAHARIKIVAKRLCFQIEDPSEIDHLEAYQMCVLKTLADTVRRINAPSLAALEK
jgi:UrcA family protein